MSLRAFSPIGCPADARPADGWTPPCSIYCTAMSIGAKNCPPLRMFLGAVHVWGFLRLLHGFLNSCMVSSHFVALGVDSFINKQVTSQMILVSGTFVPILVASDSPMRPGAHSHRVPRRTRPEDTLPSKTECSPRAQQTSPMAMPTRHAALFSNSPRKHTQAFSLRHQTAGGQIK